MSKEYLNLNDIEIAERMFHSSKSSIALNDVDFHKTLISEKFGNAKNERKLKNYFKYFIGYKNNEKVYLLCIRHPQMTGYLNGFKENKYMNFLIKDNQLLKKCNKIWDNLMATR